MNPNVTPPTITYWEGKFGAGCGTLGGGSARCTMYFKDGKVSFSDWSSKEGHDKSTYTSNHYNKCGVPTPTQVTELNMFDSVGVPTNNDRARNVFSGSTLYDNYGVIWPMQYYSMKVEPSDKHIKVDYFRDNNWWLDVYPDSNASNDYKIVLTETPVDGNYSFSREITVHTFDYNFTFVDGSGKEIDKQTVDSGAKVTPPKISGASDVTWTCDQYADWQNTKDGPQTRIVKATAVVLNTKAAAPTMKAGKKGKLSIDWSSFRQKMQKKAGWKKVKSVEVQYSTDPKLKKNVKSKTIKKGSVTKKSAKTVLSKLKKNKTYYFRVRLSYGNDTYSKWSKVVKIRTKS